MYVQREANDRLSISQIYQAANWACRDDHEQGEGVDTAVRTVPENAAPLTVAIAMAMVMMEMAGGKTTDDKSGSMHAGQQESHEKYSDSGGIHPADKWVASPRPEQVAKRAQQDNKEDEMEIVELEEEEEYER